MSDRLIIVGNPGEIHVGAHLFNAAKHLDLDVRFCDVRESYNGPLWLTKINWHLRGHRPVRLKDFSKKIVRTCLEFRPRWLLATGIVPVELSALAAVKKSGVSCINYLTDDPWNPAHSASWFKKTLPVYDGIFSPRRANMIDLRRSGCRDVSYLPFAYAPELHFPQPITAPDGKSEPGFDLLFAGGADRQRILYISALINAGFKVGLYGGYWDRFRKTRPYAFGHAGPQMLRSTIANCKAALCLVRRANRDGHSMRTFEIPAVGACMLTEDTEEHREIFGDEDRATVYFKDTGELIQKAGSLIADEPRRKGLAGRCHDLITGGGNTYKDRLLTMLKSAEL